MKFQLTSTGDRQQMSRDMLQARDRAFEQTLAARQRNHAHLWIMTVAFRVDPERMAGGDVLLDAENILTFGVGCYVCEQPYSKQLATRSCPGEPS